MVVIVRADASAEERAELSRLLDSTGDSMPATTVATPVGDVLCLPARAISDQILESVRTSPAVARIVSVDTSYQLASRQLVPEKTVVRVGPVAIGSGKPVVIAGPCSVESEAQIMEAATAARNAGARMLRGGAFKPRTSPYAFQGLGMPGVRMLARAGAEVGLPVVTEVMEPDLVPAVAEFADMLQIGSRNMQNFPLLRAAGKAQRPVLLKRGFAATVEEWLLAAEYVLAEGNSQVVLCERGIRGFDSYTRNVLDLACVPLLGALTHLPVIVDPSHATGRRDMVAPMSLAAIAAGADGLLIE